jgi:hypothetical protein
MQSLMNVIEYQKDIYKSLYCLSGNAMRLYPCVEVVEMLINREPPEHVPEQRVMRLCKQ